MSDEIQKNLSLILDKDKSNYFRKDALRQLARMRKSDELDYAVLTLLEKVKDPSLQRDVMDLAVQFSVAEAVALLKPVATEKNQNSRHAINTIFKIGGVEAYKTLSEISNTPGFDLSKTAAKHALEDLIRRNPHLANEVEPKNFDYPNKPKIEINTLQNSPQETKQASPDELNRTKRELSELQERYENLGNQLQDKVLNISQLEDKIRELKNQHDGGNDLKEAKRALYEANQEIILNKTSHEKELNVYQTKIFALEREIEQLQKRVAEKPNSKKSGGCFGKIIIVIVIIYIANYFFNKAADSDKDLDKIRKEMHNQQEIILDKFQNN